MLSILANLTCRVSVQCVSLLERKSIAKEQFQFMKWMEKSIRYDIKTHLIQHPMSTF